MAISLRGTPTSTTSGAALTAINPTVPTGATTGDLSVLTVAMKPFGTTVTTPSGWTKIGEYANGSTATSAADNGSVKVAVFVRESAPAGAIGNLTFSGANSAMASVVTYAKAANEVWDYSAWTTAGRNSSAANYSVTGAAGLNVIPGDMVVTCSANAMDTTAPTAPTIAGMASVTFVATTASRISAGTTIGNDVGITHADRVVSGNWSSAAPTYAHTQATNNGAATIFLRLRPSGPKVETLVDDFNTDNRPTKWPHSYGINNVSGGVATVSSSAAQQYSGLQTLTNPGEQFSVVESYLKVKWTIPTVLGNYGPMLMPLPANGTDIKIQWENGTLYFGQRSGYSFPSPATLATAAGSTVWVGFGEGVAGAAKFGKNDGVAGNLYYFSSTNGTSWTLRKTDTTPPYANAVTVILDSDSTNSATSTYDNLNVDEAVPSDFTGTLALTGGRTLDVSQLQYLRDSYIRTPTTLGEGTGTIVVNTPTGARVGDLLLYFYGTSDTVTTGHQGPAGFTAFAGGGSATRGGLRLSYKTVEADDIGKTWTFTAPVISSTNPGFVMLAAIANADTSSPLSMNESVSISAGGSTQPQFPAKSSSMDKAMTYMGSQPWSASSGLTQTAKSSAIVTLATNNSAAANEPVSYIGGEYVPLAGVTQSTRVIQTNATANWLGWTLIFKPLFENARTPATAPRYYTTAPVLSAVDAATTIAELESALDQMQADYGIRIELGLVTSTSLGTKSWTNPDITDPNLKPAVKAIVDALAKYPPAMFDRFSVNAVVFTKNITDSGGGSADIGGFCLNSQMFLDIDNLNTNGGFETIFHHELFHVLNNQYEAYINNLLETDWLAVNPPGFTYLGSGYDAAYSGSWPEGFVRTYSRHSIEEDMAETWAWIMSTGRQADLATRVASDPYIPSKVALLKSWIADRTSGEISGATYYTAVNTVTGYSGSVSLSGSGSTSVSGAPAHTGSRALSGGRTLSLSGSAAHTGSLALSGGRTLGVSGSPASSGSVSLGQTGTDTLNGSPAVPGTLARTGSGALSVSGSLGQSGSINLGQTGNTVESGTPAPSATLALGQAGGLARAGAPAVPGAVTFTRSRTLNLSGAPAMPGALTIGQAGALNLTGFASLSGTRTRLFAPYGITAWTSNDGPINLGTRFTVDTTSTVTGGRYWKPGSTNDGQTITMSLYDGGTTPLATVTRVQQAGDPVGWVNLAFPSTVTVNPGTTYTIAWHTTGTNYAVSDNYPLTGWDYAPLHAPANWAVYGYGAVAKPTSAGGYGYLIDVAILERTAQTPTSVKVLDTDNIGMNQAWFDARYAEGFRMFVTSGTPWSGAVTLDQPKPETEAQLGMALAAGMKIGLYTRDPRHWQSGLTAAGQYKSQLQFFALDVETDPGIPVTRAMVNGVRDAGVRPIIYAGSGSWATIQGATANDFADVPLWDTNTNPALDEASWTAEYLAPPPFAYGGWNVAGNMRVGVQQKFEVTSGAYKIDLNSFNEAFLIETKSGSLTLTGQRTLALPGSSQHTGSLGLSGTGNTTEAGAPGHTGTRTLGQAGALVVAGSAQAAATVTLTGSRTLALPGAVAVPGSLARTGTGALSFTATAQTSGALTLGATGMTAVSGSPDQSGALNLGQTGALTGTGAVAVPGNLTLAGNGSLAVSGEKAVAGSVALGQVGSLALSGAPGQSSSLTLGQSRSLTASGTPAPSATLGRVMDGGLSLSGDGSINASGELDLTASSMLFRSGAPNMTGTLAVFGDSDLSIGMDAFNINGSLALTGNRAWGFGALPEIAGALNLTAIIGESLTGSPSVGGSLSRSGVGGTGVNQTAVSTGGTLSRSLARSLALVATAITAAGALNLTGVKALVLAGSAAQDGAGSFTMLGDGALTLSGRPSYSGTLNRGMAGGLARAGSPQTTGALVLDLDATVTVAGVPAVVGELSLGILGELLVDGNPVLDGSLILGGTALLDLFGGSSNNDMFFKNGTRVQAFILSGGQLIPIVPQVGD